MSIVQLFSDSIMGGINYTNAYSVVGILHYTFLSMGQFPAWTDRLLLQLFHTGQLGKEMYLVPVKIETYLDSNYEAKWKFHSLNNNLTIMDSTMSGIDDPSWCVYPDKETAINMAYSMNEDYMPILLNRLKLDIRICDAVVHALT